MDINSECGEIFSAFSGADERNLRRSEVMKQNGGLKRL
jgi:hypothetical protein